MKKIYYPILVLLLLAFASCNNILDIKNENNIDRDRLLDTDAGINSLSASAYYGWYYAQYTGSYFDQSPAIAMWCMADQGTSSWGNNAMRELSAEPRVAYNNTIGYERRGILERYYSRLMSAISSVNDVLFVLNNGKQVGELDTNGKGKDTEKVRAFNYLTQGAILGSLGLVFDKSFVVKEDMSPEVLANLKISDYSAVVDSAIVSLEKCIKISDENEFLIDDNWISGMEYTNAELSQLAHSIIARLMVYKARNKTQNDQTDWAKVLEHANNGIQKSLAPYIDNTTWVNGFFYYTVARDNWARIDARIINLMDNSYPYHIESTINPGEATSNDARLLKDFHYNPICGFHADRGYYYLSYYEYTRYPYTFDNADNVVEFSVAENELIKAEAMFRTGDKAGAISVINAGTRTTRGELAPLSSSISDEDLLKAIFYERDIELICTGFGIAYYDMRRRDMLQYGTMLHFPLPAKDLSVMGIPEYTFGGVENADGINTSNGGWFPSK